ncbi:Ubiquitin family protein [Zalerion maritima]|uniref:Ubiquitin family protein n=1 Tax=Zalerion maritima TaxID=339359 RepID=A0AAD5RSK2_9PEZI|nr:Ubiquitin family protein [Zalerion maritima]
MADQTLVPVQIAGPQERTLTIVIVTPGTEHPTKLENIGLRTTVGELKKMIKEQSPLHPTENRQRLIFHGRALLRDETTLIDALGEAMTRERETVTIHMAIRESGQDSNPTNPATATISSPALGNGSASSSSTLPRAGNPLQPNQPQMQTQHHLHQPRIARHQVPGGPANIFTPMNVPAAMAQQNRQFMAQWANHLHREGLNRQIINAQNQHRAAMNAGGQGSPTSQPSVLPTGYGQIPTASTPPPGYHHPLGTAAENTRGRSSPAPNLQPGMTRTIVREGVSPDGTHWRIVNQHPTPVDPSHRPPGNGGLSAQDIQNMLRNADATNTSQAVASAMQRSASNVSHQSGLQQPPVGVTTPLMPGSRPLSRTATPDATRTPSHGSSGLYPGASGASATGPAAVQPQVYLVQSPEGPRAILFNQTGTWYTPLVHAQPPSPVLLFNPGLAQPMPALAAQPAPTPTVANPQGLRQRHPQRGNGDGIGQRVVVQRRQNVRRIHPANAGGAAFLAHIWPHVWLFLRLGLFVWWFTGSETSWPRWIAIVSISTLIFLLNTGILNGVADQAWGPLRRHFENMIPLQAPRPRQNRRQGGAAPAAPGNQNDVAAREPNPADMAARLVEQRREGNAGWFVDQVRRVERASLLFLASLAPGIAERHIRHVEEEQQRRERERREREEAEQRAAQEREAAAANEGSNETTNEAQNTENAELAEGRNQGEPPAA